MKTMNELMLHFMQDILYAEKQGIREMAKMAKAVDSPRLKDLVLHHRDQSQQQVSRLERVFEALGKRPRAKVCAAMNGLTEEVEDVIDESDRGPVRDAALIAGMQAVEHYEIARYGALIAWAKQAELPDAAELLQETLDEEKENDRLLSELADTMLNPAAAESREQPDEDTHQEAEPEPEPASEPEPEQQPAARRRGAVRKAKPAAVVAAPAPPPVKRAAKTAATPKAPPAPPPAPKPAAKRRARK